MTLQEAIREWLQANIGPPLRSLHQPIDHALAGLPMSVAKIVVIAFFVASGVAVWSLPRKFVYLGAPDEARWRDLRIWAILVLVPYILVYGWLG